MEECSNFKTYTFFGYIILGSLSVASCLSSLFGGFVFDDTEVILNNEDILPKTPISNIFFHDYWGSSIKHNLSHKSYRPLTILTFRLNYILFGGFKPWSFHLVNIILHAVISLLSWSVFAEILGHFRSDYALFASLIFALHPVHSEAVCGIVGRADLLAALFFFLSFLAFAKAIAKGSNDWNWLFTSVLLAAVSMFCKEQGVTVLGFLSVYDILTHFKLDVFKLFRPWDYRSGGKRSIPGLWTIIIRQSILIISAVSLILFRYYLMDFQSPPFQVLDNPASFEKDWITRILSYNYIFCLNLWLLFCPDWLCFDWSMGCIPVVKYFDKRVIFVAFLWVAFGFTIWKALSARKGRKQRDILVSIALMVIPFLPASNIFFRVGFVLAERVLYIPSAGFCLLVACGMEVIVENFPLRKKDITFGFSVLTMLFLIRSHERSSEWISEETLFNSGLNVCPLNAKVHYNVAIAALNSGNVSQAVFEYKEAISACYTVPLVNPFLRKMLVVAQSIPKCLLVVTYRGTSSFLHVCLVRVFFHHSFIGVLRIRVSAKSSSHQSNQKLYPDYYQAYNNLANILKNEGNLNAAEELLEKALAINKEFPAAWMNLGVVLAQKKNFKKAEECYFQALKFRKNYPDCYYNLGKLYLEENRLIEAEKSWRTAINLKPTFTVAWNNLIILTSQKGNHHQAATLAKEALALLENEPSIHFNLGNALGKLGEFPEAESHFLRAIQLNKDNPQYYVNLGVLYHRWKKYKKAEECYQKALKLEPTFKAAKENYSLLKKVLDTIEKG